MSFDNITKVEAIFIYTLEKTRILAQYYSNRIPDEQKESFESDIYDRSQQDSESLVFLHKDYVVVISRETDFISFIIGDKKSNELILEDLQNNLFTVLETLFNSQVDTLQLTEQIGTVYLVLDNMIDQGYPFITQCDEIVANVSMKDSDSSSKQTSTASKAASLLGFFKRGL